MEEGGFHDPVEEFHQQANQPAAAAAAPPAPHFEPAGSLSKIEQRLGPEGAQAAATRRAQIEQSRQEFAASAERIHPLAGDATRKPMYLPESKNTFQHKLNYDATGKATSVTLSGRWPDFVGEGKTTQDVTLPITYRDTMYRYVNANSPIHPLDYGFPGVGAYGVNQGKLNTYFDDKTVWMARTAKGAENFGREQAERPQSRVPGIVYKVDTRRVPLIDVEGLSKNNPELYHKALANTQGRSLFTAPSNAPEVQDAIRARSEAYQPVVALNQEHVAMGPFGVDKLRVAKRIDMSLPSEYDPKQNSKTAKVQAVMQPFKQATKNLIATFDRTNNRFVKELNSRKAMRQALFPDAKGRQPDSDA